MLFSIFIYLGIQRQPKLTREDEDLVPSLYDQINRLKGQNTMLTEKIKELQDSLDKKKRELAISKKVLQSKKSTPTSRYILIYSTLLILSYPIIYYSFL